MSLSALGASAVGEGAVGTAAGSSAAGTAAGTAAGETGATSAISEIASYVGGSSLSEGLSPISTLVGMIQSRKARELQVEQFGIKFEENKRRFGLEFALREWATRKNMALNVARQLYNQQQGFTQMGLRKKEVFEGVRGAAQARLQQEEQFRWLREDREKTKKVAQSYNKGILSGIFGRDA